MAITKNGFQTEAVPEIHNAPGDLYMHLKAVRRLVAEEKYRALVEEQKIRRAESAGVWSWRNIFGNIQRHHHLRVRQTATRFSAPPQPM